ncbi:MAG: TIGR02147 family protein [Bdellovibrionales bacterium]|nr:TIGR02147 family protein [Bdellovibrionales bacterium]
MIQNYTNYVTYLNHWIKSNPGGGHGVRKKIAEVLRMQTSYLSQVLSGTVTLKEEYVIPLARYLNLDPLESDYFMALVGMERASSVELRRYYKEITERLRSKLQQAALKGSSTEVRAGEDISEYYSSWHYSAIHMMSLTRPISADYVLTQIKISKSKVDRILKFLLANGFVTYEKGLYKYTQKSIHLERNHKWVHQHHINWRLKAIDQMQLDTDKNLHYTSVAVCTAKDAEVIKNRLHETIREIRRTISEAQDEAVYAYSIDFYPLFAED